MAAVVTIGLGAFTVRLQSLDVRVKVYDVAVADRIRDFRTGQVGPRDPLQRIGAALGDRFGKADLALLALDLAFDLLRLTTRFLERAIHGRVQGAGHRRALLGGQAAAEHPAAGLVDMPGHFAVGVALPWKAVFSKAASFLSVATRVIARTLE